MCFLAYLSQIHVYIYRITPHLNNLFYLRNYIHAICKLSFVKLLHSFMTVKPKQLKGLSADLLS